uniref:Uncharacterized protein n=2 Tax=Nicotiana TaxID=4085 RepID=A0A1S4BL55_TOBAC|nr:PREDICTED: uncharacterized protein LOC104245835 [Nicotiana sylvestris]XP_009799839.1 PREDICTED: uncharacterized protein LOC104245835 [Nicotiana sylvestris]XP_009799845.1 PREDICTED: uncharacterized protein LOC104245835 [Nicotiana sylvestris]XP_016489599.1 PREDICTED: uncharacterized protein LOC107809467 [Nicotiana tabacum]
MQFPDSRSGSRAFYQRSPIGLFRARVARTFKGPVGGPFSWPWEGFCNEAPSGDEDVLPQSPAPKQAKEKKRKGIPSSPNSEKQKPRWQIGNAAVDSLAPFSSASSRRGF